MSERAAAVRYRRSPYLVATLDGDGIVLVDGETARRFRVDPRALAVLARCEAWTSAAELSAEDAPFSTEDLDRLADLGILLRDDGSHPPEDRPGGVHWNPLEIAVHRASNAGGFRADQVEGRGRPPSAFKARPEGPATALPRPRADLGEPFGRLLARRRSVRSYAPRPLFLEELSSLLHHAARVIATGADSVLGEWVLHPYPGGGARSELEIYVVASDVEGLEAGAHWYDARSHDLVRIRSCDGHQAELLRSVHAATGNALSGDPPAVLVITAVFARIMWKYRGIGLSLVYKDTGCLFQTLYLVAIALGLAPCAVGGGQELANSRWLGLDPLVEAQVGCFLVGPRAEADAGGGDARPKRAPDAD